MDPIDRVRAFNRFATGRLGLPGRSYLGSGLGLTEVRVLWEVVHAPAPPAARDLARTLALDEGQLSRLLRRLAERGWIERRPSPADARRAELRPTQAGRAALAPLEARSREAVGTALSHLGPGDLARLTGAMATVEALMRPPGEAPAQPGVAAPPGVELRDLAPGDAGWLVMQHGALYARDEGFDMSFEALVAEILAAFLRERDLERERAWIAWEGDGRLGSIFIVDGGDAAAKLRLFLLVPEARGRGLGRRLLRTAMGWARERGYRRIRLWTHESHRAACALYAAEGFERTASRPARSFGRDVVEQEWERPL